MKQALHQLNGTCTELTELFRLAAESDKKAERNTNIGCTVGFLALFAMVGTGMITAEMSNSHSNVAIPGTLAFLSFLAFVWGIWFYRKNSLFDIEDDKLELVRELLPLLQTDTKDNQVLSVKIDFRPATHEKAEFVLAEKVVGNSFYGDVKSYKVSQKWFQLQGRLVDGTAYKIEVERQGKDKVKPKKKGRTKVKSRMQERISVSLRPSPSRYPDLTNVKKALPKSPPNSLKILNLKPQDNQLRADFVTPQAKKMTYRGLDNADGMENLASADNIAAALVYLYRGLKGLKAQTIGS